MAIVASVRIVVVCLAVVFTSTAAPAQSPFETPPVLKAQDLAPAGLLLGPRYRVDDRRLAIFISGATAFIGAAS